MLEKVLAISALCSFVLLSAIVQSAVPSSMHPLGILMVFFLIYVLVLSVLTFFIYSVFIFILRLRHRSADKRVVLRRSYVYSLILAMAPVMMIAISSIGRFGAYEASLIIVFELVACFYVSKHK